MPIKYELLHHHVLVHVTPFTKAISPTNPNLNFYVSFHYQAFVNFECEVEYFPDWQLPLSKSVGFVNLISTFQH